MKGVDYEVETELDRLSGVFPAFQAEVSGKAVVDVGCGTGAQAIAIALRGAIRVLGVDIDINRLEEARRQAAIRNVSDRVSFATTIPKGWGADLVVSQNSVEHFLKAGRVLADMEMALAPGGRILISFGPPWYAPWGAHMGFFCRLPWMHLMFSERSIMEVRSMFRSDGARTFADAGLARMSVAMFEHLISVSKLRCEYVRYDCVRGMNWIGRTPLRELFVNRISCVLVRGSEAAA